jgi:hypothetical protein
MSNSAKMDGDAIKVVESLTMVMENQKAFEAFVAQNPTFYGDGQWVVWFNKKQHAVFPKTFKFQTVLSYGFQEGALIRQFRSTIPELPWSLEFDTKGTCNTKIDDKNNDNNNDKAKKNDLVVYRLECKDLVDPVFCGPTTIPPEVHNVQLKEYINNCLRTHRIRATSFYIEKISYMSASFKITITEWDKLTDPAQTAAPTVVTSCGPCGSTEHDVFQCPHRFCDICKTNDHWTTRCLTKRFCDICNTPDHWSFQCPSIPKFH